MITIVCDIALLLKFFFSVLYRLQTDNKWKSEKKALITFFFNQLPRSQIDFNVQTLNPIRMSS